MNPIFIMNQKENFCPVFESLKQLARKKGLNIENTPLNKEYCPFAQACLGLARGNEVPNDTMYNFLLNQCQFQENDPPFRRIYLSQKGPKPYNPLEAFYRRLEKTTEMLRGIKDLKF